MSSTGLRILSWVNIVMPRHLLRKAHLRHRTIQDSTSWLKNAISTWQVRDCWRSLRYLSVICSDSIFRCKLEFWSLLVIAKLVVEFLLGEVFCNCFRMFLQRKLMIQRRAWHQMRHQLRQRLLLHVNYLMQLMGLMKKLRKHLACPIWWVQYLQLDQNTGSCTFSRLVCCTFTALYLYHKKLLL